MSERPGRSQRRGEGVDSERAGKGGKQAAPARKSHGGADGRTSLAARVTPRTAECERREENRHTLALHRRALPFLLGGGVEFGLQRRRLRLYSHCPPAAPARRGGPPRLRPMRRCLTMTPLWTRDAWGGEVLVQIRDGRGDGGCGDGRPRRGGLPEHRAGQDAGWADASGGDGWRSPARGARGDGWAGPRQRCGMTEEFRASARADVEVIAVALEAWKGLERKPLPAPFLRGCSSMSSPSGTTLRFSISPLGMS
ncbi:hypothetical protein FB451DRAFT_1364510 [Mycena latifolia]|nr:hypothetical protein FB451DRAFT_1364510 [Mycena latifolia]